MLGLEQTTSGEELGLVQDRKEIMLPFMMDQGSCMFYGSSSELSETALQSAESASPQISIEWGYAIRIKDAKPSCNLCLLAEFAIDASRPA